MSDGPPFTVLDAELSSLARRAREELPIRSARSAGSRAAGARARADLLQERQSGSFLTSLKVMVKTGWERDIETWISQQGGRVVSGGARVLLAELPARALAELEALGGVLKAEMPRVLQPRLEECRGPATGLGRALERHGLTGEGVVVGVIDSGIDWSHPDFREEDGSSSRIELFIHAHRKSKFEPSQYQIFDGQALQEALQGSRSVPEGDPDGHGTHCASIAAGNGRASKGRFCGVAPRAALMALRSEPLLDDHTILGIQEFFHRAGNRPAVISLSLGSHLGAHDGTAILENVVSRESGPGRIIVVAAGNEGGDGIHWHGGLVEGTDLVIPFRIADRAWQFVDVWVHRGDEVEVFIETPDGAPALPADHPVHTAYGSYTARWRRDTVNLDCNLSIFLEQGKLDQIWKIRLRPQSVLHGEVHAWSGTATPATSRHLFPGVVDRHYSVGIPATEERAIAVASWVCRSSYDGCSGTVHTPDIEVGQLSTFSSEGPTRHGALKPDIAAPGQYITAALAAGSTLEADPQYKPLHHPLASYITLQGTSMATPFVAGVIALMLEREPRLTPEEVQQRLRITARRDRYTRRVWSSGFGFGKIDVEALLNYRS